tara:strand:- start:757 stop:1452 length:696 start_codon:yes stop_codon:yes gene_type:complete
MQVKDILFKNCKDLTEIDLPEWLEPEVNDNGCTIKSYAWKSDKLRRLRLCNLNLKGKFIAESLVIYPDWDLNNPVFGTEYVIAGGKRFFGTIDFHPLDMRKEYIDHYINKDLRDQPDRGKDKSNVYDLNKYFSKKLWIKVENNDFYEKYLKSLDLYLSRYLQQIKRSKRINNSKGDIGFGCNTIQPAHIAQKGYDYHLASTDPAYGILKTYYNSQFADKYINTFLFDMSRL